jgi:hypothetical protein
MFESIVGFSPVSRVPIAWLQYTSGKVMMQEKNQTKYTFYTFNLSGHFPMGDSAWKYPSRAPAENLLHLLVPLAGTAEKSLVYIIYYLYIIYNDARPLFSAECPVFGNPGIIVVLQKDLRSLRRKGGKPVVRR